MTGRGSRATSSRMALDIGGIREVLADQASLLDHSCKTISASQLTLPGPAYLDDVFTATDRTPRVLGAMAQMYRTGRLANTRYPSRARTLREAGNFSVSPLRASSRLPSNRKVNDSTGFPTLASTAGPYRCSVE